MLCGANTGILPEHEQCAPLHRRALPRSLYPTTRIPLLLLSSKPLTSLASYVIVDSGCANE